MANTKTAEIGAIRLHVQGAKPDQPATDYVLLYQKAGGIYYEDSAGTEHLLAEGAGHDALTLEAALAALLTLTGQALELKVQSANKVLAGPTTGADAAPTVRALVAADMPAAYITAAGVTQEALAANGDVGTGSDQVAVGDHTHPAGTVRHVSVFHFYGDLEVGAHPAPIVNRFGATATVIGVYLHVKTGKEPTGAAVIADVHLNGVTAFTTQSNRPQIAAAGVAGNSTTIENDQWADGTEMLPALDQVGSTLPGTDLVMEVVFTV